ncbi:MAG: hypothetical protein ACTSX4_07340 [Candidatus Helarchaeota archaeon]
MGEDIIEEIHKIVDEIKTFMGSLIGTRVYVGVYDNHGNGLLVEDALEGFRDFITSFIKTNFKLLDVNDHSLPLSGHGIIFFKIDENVMIVLYIKKGKVGQLLAFKPRVKYFGEKLTPLILASELDREVKEPIIIREREEEKKVEKSKIIKRDIGIKPVMTKKITGKEKFDINEAKLFTCYDGEHTIEDIKQEHPNLNVDKLIFKHVNNKYIKLDDSEIFETNCPECKAKHYFYIPKYARNIANDFNSPIKIQIYNEMICPHLFLVFLDKKSKIKSKILEKIAPIENEIDFYNFNLKSLIKFFGQDIVFSMFHAFLFKKQVLIIIENEKLDELFKFWKRVFPTISRNEEGDFITIPPKDYNKKMYQDSLIIDFNSNSILHEPYEPELDFEMELYKKLIQIDEQKQILFLNQEIERILGLTDEVIEVIARFSEITEERLVEKLAEKGMELQYKEIPIIKILGDIYYNDDTLFKKIKKTVVGKMSEFLSTI